MSMTNRSARELRALREVAHFLLPLVCCEFCGKPLLDPKLADKVFGDKAHSPLKDLRLTTHHRNGKHKDNRRTKLLEVLFGDDENNSVVAVKAISGNTSLVHRPCHGAYEAKRTSKKTVRKLLRERANELLKIISHNPMHRKPSESSFVVKVQTRLTNIWNKKPVSLYEIRRLKKIAAKVKGSK